MRRLTIFNYKFTILLHNFLYICNIINTQKMEENKKSNRHVQVPNSVASNIDSNKKTRYKKHYTDVLVYGFLRKNMDGKTMVAFISLRGIAEATDMSVGGVTAAIKRLEESGDVTKIKMEGGRNQNGYKFNPHSEKFEMYDLNFLENKELNNLQKSYYMIMQPHLYVNKDTGIGKTTYSDLEISELTGISKTVAQERRKELERMGFINRRTTTDIEGNSCEALEFNLPKFGQYVICKIDEHSEVIARQQMEINKLKQDMEIMKKFIKNSNAEDIII